MGRVVESLHKATAQVPLATNAAYNLLLHHSPLCAACRAEGGVPDTPKSDDIDATFVRPSRVDSDVCLIAMYDLHGELGRLCVWYRYRRSKLPDRLGKGDPVACGILESWDMGMCSLAVR